MGFGICQVSFFGQISVSVSAFRWPCTNPFIGNLENFGGLTLPSATRFLAVSGSVRDMAIKQDPESMQRSQNIHLHPILLPSAPPMSGPALGAVVILSIIKAVPFIGHYTYPNDRAAT